MSTADAPSSSYQSLTTAYRLSFAGEKRENTENYNTLLESIIEAYKIYKKRTGDTPLLLNHARTYQLLFLFWLRDSEILKISRHLQLQQAENEKRLQYCITKNAILFEFKSKFKSQKV